MGTTQGGSPLDVVAYVLDCDIVTSKFELQPRFWVHFRTNTLGENMNLLIYPQAMNQIVPLLFFYKDALALNNQRKLICH